MTIEKFIVFDDYRILRWGGNLLVMQKAKHNPETCPAYDKKYLAVTVNWYEKLEAVAAKYNVKVVGAFNDHGGHAVYTVYETPSMDAFMGFMMEPDMMGPLAFCTSEIKPVFSAKETLAMLKK
jgi:hypothetical protein